MEQTIQGSTIQYSIVHQMRGRVRFRIPRLARDPDYVRHLQQLIESDSRVSQVRLKPAAASIAVDYRTEPEGEAAVRSMRSHLVSLIEKAEFDCPQTQPEVPVLTLISPETEQWTELKLAAVTTFLASLREVGKVPLPRPLLAAMIAITSIPTLKRAFMSLLGKGKFNIDCLDALAVTFASVQGNYLTPSLLLLLRELGEYIRDRTARSSLQRTTDLLSTLGSFAWVERDGSKQRIPVDAVQVGETVIIYPGEQIPVDGTVLKGQALIDEQRLTGESVPVVRNPGQAVYASTLVRSGEIYLKAEKVGQQTRAGASLELLKQAPVHDTRMANYAEQIGDRAVVPAFLLAGGVFAVTRNPARAASILTLDFVTGIRVSLPTTFLAALNHATRHGVLVRSGRALEKLAQVDTLVFDKTGTLTQGDLQVVDVKTFPDRLPRARVLELAAAAEQRLTHPLAEAISHYAQLQGIPLLPRGKWHYEIGLGVRAEIEGEEVLVGSDRFLEQNGIGLDCFYEQHPCLLKNCHNHPHCPISAHASLIYVASQGQFQGAIQYADPLRPESQAVIATLQKQYGMEIHLLTGDTPKRALAVASSLQIPPVNVHAQAFPEQKAEIVRQLHEAGKTVAFVGDGLNDSVALAYADVSISFAQGSEVARETADVVLMDGSLTELLDAIAIAQETKQLIQQNINLSVIPNVAALSLASTVGLHPLAAAIVHNGSAIAAGLNGLRPLMHSHTS